MKELTIKVSKMSKNFMMCRRSSSSFQFILGLLKGEKFKFKKTVFSDVDFFISRGSCVAIVGENGSGKTTLMRLLAGIYKPTNGKVQLNGRVSSFFRFYVGLHQDLTVQDNIFLLGAFYGLKRNLLKGETDRILEDAGLKEFRDIPLHNLSIGQQQRLTWSVYFRVEADIYLFDEGAVFLDTNFQMKVERYLINLKSKGKTLLMTGHDFNQVKRVCDQVLIVADHKISQISENEYFKLLGTTKIYELAE